jgi:hypothetical protein
MIDARAALYDAEALPDESVHSQVRMARVSGAVDAAGLRNRFGVTCLQ